VGYKQREGRKEGSAQGGGKGMDTGKQALTKPQKKVGVPQKKGGAEEGKGGEPHSFIHLLDIGPREPACTVVVKDR
jgi:hypothetical protein